MMQHSVDNVAVLRQAIDSAIESLGGPIHKTITWYMNSKGIFSDSKKIDIDYFYLNLKELVGPGADLIMEETWQHLQKQGFAEHNFEPKSSPLEKIQKIMRVGESA
jgi:hypothetical protein